MQGSHVQNEQRVFTFENTDWGVEWCYLRHHCPENYELSQEKAVLHGTDITLDMTDSPTFIGMRQRDFHMELRTTVSVSGGSDDTPAVGGVTAYITENEHYDLALEQTDKGCRAVLMLNIGGIKHRQCELPVSGDTIELIMRSDCFNYSFFAVQDGREIPLGSGSTKYLSSEVAEGFTGVMTALYAVGGKAVFTGFSCRYSE